ncbi:MAG: hypothetical protein KJ906_02385 [Nanoarchaeota archaeon]|nr:hypothetical protein [Nanoarchaeota archaeon]
MQKEIISESARLCFLAFVGGLMGAFINSYLSNPVQQSLFWLLVGFCLLFVSTIIVMSIYSKK